VVRLALVAVLACAGCKKPAPPSPPQFVDVKVVDRSPERREVLDLKALTAKAAETIHSSTGIAVTDGGTEGAGRRFKLRVEVRTEGAEDAKTKHGILRALVYAKVTPLGGELGSLSFEQTAVAEREYEIAKLGDPTAAWQAHVEHAISDVVIGVGARVKLAGSDASALTAALDGKDGDLREESARLCAERKERACVPALVKLLKSEDHDDRDRAIGALQSIGDPRAVRPLTEVARFRDLSDLPKVLDALAAIGGDEARSYLEFVASGHDSSEIRDLAKQALATLEQHTHDMATPAHAQR
jgi:hypothetical protein